MKQPVLIFDFDGTIADTFQYILRLSNRLAAEFKYKSVNPDEIETLKDKTSQEVARHLQVPFMKIPLIVAKARSELQKDIEKIEPIDGLKEVLVQLKSIGYTMGILTSNSLPNVTQFLENHGLALFDFINTTSKVWGKNFHLKNLTQDDRYSIEDMLYIGDETRDIEAAKKVGIRMAAVTWGYNSRRALAEHNPDFILDKPNDLLKLCKAWLAD